MCGVLQRQNSSSTHREDHTLSVFLEKVTVNLKLLYTQLYIPIMLILILTMLPIRKKNWKKRSMGKLELIYKSHSPWNEKGAKRGSSRGNLFPFPDPLYSF